MKVELETSSFQIRNSQQEKINQQTENHDKKQHNVKTEKKFKRDEVNSPRGRRSNNTNFYATKNNFKSSAYRNSSSKSTKRFSDRRATATANYNSDSVSDYNSHDVNVNLLTKINTIQAYSQSNTNKNFNSNEASSRSKDHISQENITKQANNNCPCSSCLKESSDSGDEPGLCKEIYQIICDIYEAHIKNQDIKETVKRYYHSVHDFCLKEEQGDIIYLVKLFTEMIRKALKTLKESLLSNNKTHKLKVKLDEKNRIERNTNKSKNSNLSLNYNNKKILKDIYDKEMDEVIYNLLVDIYNLYVAIINSSIDIALVFSPGINRIEFLRENNFSIEYLHKELLDHIFLRDPFILNVFKIIKSNENLSSNETIATMISFIEEKSSESEYEKLHNGVEVEMKKLRLEISNLTNNLEVIKSVESKSSTTTSTRAGTKRKEIKQEHKVIMDFDDLIKYIGNNEAIVTNINKKAPTLKKKKKERTQAAYKSKTIINDDKEIKSKSKSTQKNQRSSVEEEEDNNYVESFKLLLSESTINSAFITKSYSRWSLES